MAEAGGASGGRDGVELLRLTGVPSAQRTALAERLAAAPDAAIVVVTDDGSPRHLRDLLGRGARAALPADAPVEAVEAAVTAVRAGLVCLPATAGRTYEPTALSPRQRQVVALIVMGLTNREIATRLHLTEATVKTHVAQALRKLGARSRAEAIDVVADPERMLRTGIVGLGVAEGEVPAPPRPPGATRR